MDRIKFRTMLIYSVAIGILAQVYYQPFSDMDFFISPGVIFLGSVLYIQASVSPIMLCSLSAVTTCMFRLSILYLTRSNAALMSTGLAIIFYYFVFGIVVHTCRWLCQKRTLFTIWLIIADFCGNCAEFAVLRSWSLTRIQLIILLAVLRGILSYAIYRFYQRNMLMELQRVQLENLAELNIFSSSIYAFLFYLQKDCESIEALTAQAFSLYRTENDEKILEFAKELHDVKKDIRRTVSGLNQLNGAAQKIKTMQLSQICKIVQAGYPDAVKEKRLDVRCRGEAQVENFLDYFIILNNLISNAMQAHANHVSAELNKQEKDERILIRVQDNGDGIPDDELPDIFFPGYSTKFDDRSGEISNGVGLTHVHDIVTRSGGTIDVASEPGKTVFTILLPMNEKGAFQHE